MQEHYEKRFHFSDCVHSPRTDQSAGIADSPLFVLFLNIYVVTVAGNRGMLILIWSSARLHTTMYFFLSYLYFTDQGFSSNVIPKMLKVFLSEERFPVLLVWSMWRSTSLLHCATMGVQLSMTLCFTAARCPRVCAHPSSHAWRAHWPHGDHVDLQPSLLWPQRNESLLLC